MNEKAVLIVGSMALDDLELPSTTAKNVLGGAATYAAFAASLFAPARIVAVVGEDFSQNDIETLMKHGIDTSGVERVKGKTFRWAGRYGANLTSRVTLDTQLNVFAGFQPKLPAAYRSSDYVLLANIHPALQLQVLDQVTQPKLVLADTMNFWIEGEPALLNKVLERVDVLCINDEEARLLSGVYPLLQAAQIILGKGPKSLIIKRGENGAVLVDSKGMFWVPAVPLNDAVDPTGAGDSFAGALVGYLASEDELTPESLRRALYVGTAVASFNVQAVGTARLARLTIQDVERRIAELTAMTHLPAQTHG
ncbi:MAG TPA: PfkB family carbohydrate kinase [Polyangiaceae bacterium]|jgi:sugar/nucleoside kinase (ribokinase family)|nr:MAG: putative sugar kinase YdjH [Deltaproteobacteria bacterium ADurb.Bin207]HNS97103.1 PfkB family carbohydrate kinase [Polyangiaceae bacterium]HNZ21136.1 PfkB family carbohydrate kinase [Polyangiaceae bacterium]HOD24545.1 PfkB family carbohydrate kinase [Polyangiaceae bacterium]HOE47906.1 PfkB family carbohydrate kinase [Polyangiaceae bacterium]